MFTLTCNATLTLKMFEAGPNEDMESKNALFWDLYFFFYWVRQKYLTILQNSCEWNRWRGEFVLQRSFSDTQSISAAMECWSVEHRVFAVETYFKNNSILTQRIFRRHFNIHRNECP